MLAPIRGSKDKRLLLVVEKTIPSICENCCLSCSNYPIDERGNRIRFSECIDCVSREGDDDDYIILSSHVSLLRRKL